MTATRLTRRRRVCLACVSAAAALVIATVGGCGGGGPAPETEMRLVDAATGEVFVMDPAAHDIRLVPYPHPTTGARTLFPVRSSPDGNWVVDDEAIPLLREVRSPRLGAVLDMDRGVIEMRTQDETPYSPPAGG